MNWRHRGREKEKHQQFQELAITPSESGPVAVTQSSQIFQKSATVTVTTPGGYRIEAVDAGDVIKILRAMSGGG
jgi:sulfur carrier protein ThiS